MLRFFDVTVEFTDGTTEKMRATDTLIGDNVLSIWHQNGEMAPREHKGSFPLVNIRKWVRSDDDY